MVYPSFRCQVPASGNSTDKRPGYFWIDAVSRYCVDNLTNGGEAPSWTAQISSELRSLQAPPMRVMVIAARRIPKRNRATYDAICFYVDTGTYRS